MTTVRGLHCMCTVGDKLYVIGGNHFRGTSDYDDVLSCEYYSPTLDQWTPIAAMLRGQSDVGVAVFENKIYVVGGYSWNNRCMVEIVQKYDPEKDEWHKVFDLPESLGGIRACTLTVFPLKKTLDHLLESRHSQHLQIILRSKVLYLGSSSWMISYFPFSCIFFTMVGSCEIKR